MEKTFRDMLTEIVERELAWQASLQLDSGVLPMYAEAARANALRVCPYFSCYAALALLLCPAQYAGAVRRYMDWHYAHLNSAADDENGIDGTIYDYDLTRRADGSLGESIRRNGLGKRQYDSTDSYAALFLLLAHAYHREARDSAYLIRHGPALARIFRAMCATYDGGLTYARPDWKLKYTMDNCETAQGLSAAEALFDALWVLTGEDTYAGLARASQGRRLSLVRAVETRLWDAKAGSYRVGINAHGRPSPKAVDWRRAYPDAMAQLFPIFTGMLPPHSARAQALYARFNQGHAGGGQSWVLMAGDRPGRPVVNGIAVKTAAIMGDLACLVPFMTSYRFRVLDAGHPGCHNADCAHVASAAALLLRGK